MMPGRTAEMKRAWPGSTPKYPSVPGTTTISTSSERSSFSGETSSNLTLSAIPVPRRSGGLGGHLARLLHRLLDGAHHVEGALGHVVVLAGDDALEGLDGVLELDEDAGRSREDLGDVEGLRHEALDLARAGDGEPVLFRELVHAQDGDDVLPRLVGLQQAGHVAGDLVMLIADVAGVEHALGSD